MAYSMGLDHADDGRAVAPLDFDGDGDLDLAVLNLRGLRLLENTAPPRSFVRLRLVAAQPPVSALGAVVEVETSDGVVQRDYVKATTGFATQVQPELHFGLRDAARIDRVTVFWPDGSEQTLRGLPVGQLLTIREGDDQVTETQIPAWSSRPRRVDASFARDAAAVRVEGTRASLIAGPGPTVVHFWQVLADHPNDGMLLELEARIGRVRAVGVCVSPENPADVRRIVTDYDLTYPQFIVDESWMRRTFGESVQPPATLIFDREGRLRRAFYRPLREGELDSVLRVLEIGPFAADFFELGYHAFERGALDEAAILIQRSIDVDPELMIGHYFLGRIRAHQERHPEAAALFQRVVERDPGFQLAHLSLGEAIHRAGRLAEAEEALRKAIALDPQRVEPHFRLAAVLLDQDRLAEAALQLEEAVTLAPNVAALQFELGRLYVKLNRPDDAKAAFEQALKIDPSFEKARAELDTIRP